MMLESIREDLKALRSAEVVKKRCKINGDFNYTLKDNDIDYNFVINGGVCNISGFEQKYKLLRSQFKSIIYSNVAYIGWNSLSENQNELKDKEIYNTFKGVLKHRKYFDIIRAIIRIGYIPDRTHQKYFHRFGDIMISYVNAELGSIMDIYDFSNYKKGKSIFLSNYIDEYNYQANSVFEYGDSESASECSIINSSDEYSSESD